MTIPVIDFRRRRLSLQWYAPTGTWTAYDEPPAIVHGVGFIRATGPNVCLYALNGELRLQVDARVYALYGPVPRISCSRSVSSLGLRRRFRLTAEDGSLLSSVSYWAHKHNDFFHWLAAAAKQPDWSRRTAERWTEGLSPTLLRQEVNPQAPQA